MARKLPRKQASRPEEGRDDLAILHPQATITVEGREVTVREYGMIAGLQLRVQVQPFIADLGALFEAGGECLVEDIIDVIAVHWSLVRLAIAASAGVEPAWLDSLGDTDGDLLINTWWGVCGPFFVRPILRRKLEQLRRQASAGATSTPNSSPPASAPPTSSAATPSDSSSSSTAA
ncbi:MAG: DUF6631 family protein [Rhodanobacter sp.]